MGKTYIGKIYVGDIGTELIIDVGIDISNSDIHELIVVKPNNDLCKWNAEVYEGRYLKYVISENDFDMPGIYSLQSHIKINNMGEWYGEITQFTVYQNLEEKI